jgi:hypothetical protein
MKKRCVIVGITLLFIGIAVTPAIGISLDRDDTTPPVTTISFTPPEPDGENGWYVSNVTVTLNATDDSSGVNITQYRINEVPWETYTEPFLLNKDGNLLLEFFSIDNAGNTEPMKNATLDIDRKKPLITLNFTWKRNPWLGLDIIYTAFAIDGISGMNRVEFYVVNYNYSYELRGTITGPGPIYEWVYYFPSLSVGGFIRNPESTDEYVKFYALIVMIRGILQDPWNPYPGIGAYAYDNAGNREVYYIDWPTLPVTIAPGIYLFQSVTLPNDYQGHIGRFLIFATFYNR